MGRDGLGWGILTGMTPSLPVGFGRRSWPGWRLRCSSRGCSLGAPGRPTVGQDTGALLTVVNAGAESPGASGRDEHRVGPRTPELLLMCRKKGMIPKQKPGTELGP